MGMMRFNFISIDGLGQGKCSAEGAKMTLNAIKFFTSFVLFNFTFAAYDNLIFFNSYINLIFGYSGQL